jgi:hypothetical protein
MYQSCTYIIYLLKYERSILANAYGKKCDAIENILGNALGTCTHNYKLTIYSWLQKPYDTQKIIHQ